jgi:dTDP-glucose 4,6-dehydratase
MAMILVTGAAGFIGSCFVRGLLAGSTEDHILSLDALTYAGNLDNLAEVLNHPRHTFVRGNILDRALLARLFQEHPIDRVINFAAETHVDRSITDPEAFLDTNIKGTQALLDGARTAWSADPKNPRCRDYRPGTLFVQVSTDEVYGSLEPHDPAFREDTSLTPNSPYSAAKAGADLLVRAYGETYGFPACITRCSNNYGSHQFPEKLIPLMILRALAGQPLPVYGDGLQVRDWLHVADHCRAIELVMKGGRPGEIYNVGGGNEWANIDVIKTILSILGKPESLIQYVPDRPGHDRRYAIDAGKITRELGWKPLRTFGEGLAETVRWYIENPGWVEQIQSGAYLESYRRLYVGK